MPARSTGGSRRRSRPRGLVLLALATGAAVAGAGVLVTDLGRGGPSEVSAPAPTPEPSTDPLNREREPELDPEPGATADQLLEASEVDRLDPGARWRVHRRGPRSAGTGGSDSPTYLSCPAGRPGDPRRRVVDRYVRTFVAGGGDSQLAVEAVEVAASRSAAADAFDRLVDTYAGCREPRVQLLDSFVLHRPETDVIVLELRRWSAPVRSVTVALTRTGVVTLALVHEVDRSQGATRRAFTRSVIAAVDRLCRTSGGECIGDPVPRPAAPPPAGAEPGFLGAVDLPPVATVQSPWVGTDPAPAGPDVAAALCEGGSFGTDAVQPVRSRTFVLPRAPLPTRFGITQTVAVMGSPAAAGRLVQQTAEQIRTCPDRRLTAAVTGGTTISAGEVHATAWRLTYELARSEVYHRIGVVRAGRVVSQLTLSPTAAADPGLAAFERLLARAGQRLAELRLPPRSRG